MNIQPIVRYFLLAKGFFSDPDDANGINVLHLLNSIRSVDNPPFPILFPQLRCVVGLAGGRGTGIAQMICLEEETGLPIFGSQAHTVVFSPDPLAFTVASFRILDCRFPRPGIYSIELFWNDESLADYPLRVR